MMMNMSMSDQDIRDIIRSQRWFQESTAVGSLGELRGVHRVVARSVNLPEVSITILEAAGSIRPVALGLRKIDRVHTASSLCELVSGAEMNGFNGETTAHSVERH